VLGRANPVIAALLATTVVVTAALCGLGWYLIDQQRGLDERRLQKQLEAGAEAAVARLRGKLAETGERLSGSLAAGRLAGPPNQSGVVAIVESDQVIVSPPGSLPFVPIVPASIDSPDPFGSIETLELARNQLTSAGVRYRALARSADPAVRAGAWLRLGRVLRHSKDFSGALAAYGELAALGTVRVGTLPAELVGLDGQRATFHALGDRVHEQRAAAQLLEGIDSGRWTITRGEAEFYRETVGATAPAPQSWRLASALTDLWNDHRGQFPPRGERLVGARGDGVVVIWRSDRERTALLAESTQRFLADVIPNGLDWELIGPQGDWRSGQPIPNGGIVSRVAGSLESPWTLRVWWHGAPGSPGRSTPTILVAIVGAAVLFLWSATYFMARAMRREADVARLQSDFVAAVSHEFRSPLTTIRQMAEMLEMRRIDDDTRRHRYYSVLAGEAARLQRLVETLLDFGRMEARAQRYRSADVEVISLVGRLAAEVEPQAEVCGQCVRTSAPNGVIYVHGDEQALTTALRNLIDNALKYSASDTTVSVEVRCEHPRVLISVSDEGPGIPRHEQRTIFRKFVRGRAALDANVKGTGVGLSMVRRIVDAHGGEIRLDSEVGRGSTFTIALAMIAEPAVCSQNPEAESL
jgi:signal transduction histidine kinase